MNYYICKFVKMYQVKKREVLSPVINQKLMYLYLQQLSVRENVFIYFCIDIKWYIGMFVLFLIL